MKMKFLLLFSVLLAPRFAFAQSAPVAKTTALQVANSIEKSLRPYLKFKTFSGTFSLSFNEIEGQQVKPIFGCEMQTIYRLAGASNKIREATRLTWLDRAESKRAPQTFRVVDDGKTQTQIAVEPKLYARTQRYNEVAPFALLAPSVARIARAVRRDSSSVSTISSATENGRAVTIIDSKGKKIFSNSRAVVDADTGALQTLIFSTKKGSVTIRTSNQVFNPRLSESQFRWTAPKTFKQVAENQLPDPLQGLEKKSKPVKAPKIEDADTGDLQSWTRTHTQGSTEFRWLDTEFDMPLEDSIFVWKKPEGAKEVAPETMRLFLPF